MLSIPEIRPRRGWLRRLFLYGVLLLIVALGAASVYAYVRCRRAVKAGVYSYLHPAKRPAPVRQLASAVATEPFTVTARDGTHLEAVFYQAEAPAGTVVILHGYHGRADDSTGVARHLNQWGYNAVTYSSRAHGNSGGSMVTFGYEEKFDAVAVLAEVKRRFTPAGPHAMVGFSMGSGVIAQALPLVPELSCAVLFCPFSSMQKMIDFRMSQMKSTWQRSFAFLMRGTMERQLGFNLIEINPMEGLQHSQVPVLIIHGTKDATVPFRLGRELFEADASPKKQWLLVEGAGHGNLLAGDEPWSAEVLRGFHAFLDANMGASRLAPHS